MENRPWVFGFEDRDKVKACVGENWDAVRGLLGGRAPT